MRLSITLASHRSKGDGDYEICNDFIIDDWLRMKIKVGHAWSLWGCLLMTCDSVHEFTHLN